MVWTTRIEAHSVLHNELDRLEQNILRDKNRRFQIFLSLLALYGAFFMANIAFPIQGIALWLMLLIMGGIFFLYTFCWNVIGFILMRGIKTENVKDVIIEKGFSSIFMVQLVMIVLSACFVLPSFFALQVPFFNFWYLGFIILLIYILISSIIAYFLIRHLELKPSKKISLFLIIKILKTIPGNIVTLFSGIIPIALLVIGTFVNVKYYWVEGVLSYNLIIFLTFAQVVTFTLLIYITFINISINEKHRYSSELKSKMKSLFLDRGLSIVF
jgi:hypothetical protein